MSYTRGSSLWCPPVFVLAGCLIAASAGAVSSPKTKVLYSFQGGNDGAAPYGTLIVDGSGNLYGTTTAGGGGTCQFGGCGTVFKVPARGSNSVVYAFTGGDDGAYPYGGLVSDSNGNLYGTASGGGTHNYGTVFMIAPNGSETTLYPFQDGSDGAYPSGSLLRDHNGNLYGTAEAGGNRNSNCNSDGCGTIFEVTSAGNETVLYAFQGGTDGEVPVDSLLADGSGNLFGVTAGGGSCPGNKLGCGTVFKIAADGTETQLYDFQGGSDGEGPYAGLTEDHVGNFYGTTGAGGTGTYCARGCGTVYKLAPDGTETVLYSFLGGSDGWVAESALVMDKAGNLYGTTYAGGGSGCQGGTGCGTVFKLAPNGTEAVLFSFHNRHGTHPTAGLLMGDHGILYGTASEGGADDNGVVFRLKK